MRLFVVRGGGGWSGRRVRGRRRHCARRGVGFLAVCFWFLVAGHGVGVGGPPYFSMCRGGWVAAVAYFHLGKIGSWNCCCVGKYSFGFGRGGCVGGCCRAR